MKFPSFFKVVVMDKQRIMSPLFSGSNPDQPTANRLGSLAHQRGGKALTLENREKARSDSRERPAHELNSIVGITTKEYPPFDLRNQGSRPWWSTSAGWLVQAKPAPES